MPNIKKLKCLNALDLKILAMVLMLCDHLWATVVSGNRWLTDIGRMAFPIFAFQIVEGYFETGDLKKYLKRLFIFAFISELPFNLMYSGELFFPFHQNVLFTFCLGLLLIRWVDKQREKGKVRFIITFFLAALLGFLGGTVLMLDYYGFGILMLLLFYIFRNSSRGWIGILLGMIWINGFLMAGQDIPFTLLGHEFFFPQQAFAIFALIPIWMYNGKLGPHNKKIQLAAYSFYPAHMLIITVISKIFA